MVTKSTILGLIAALAVILIVVSMTGDDSTKYVKTIGTVAESGFSQSCVETGCYTPSVATDRITKNWIFGFLLLSKILVSTSILSRYNYKSNVSHVILLF